jgi:Amt family ammonium transporter
MIKRNSRTIRRIFNVTAVLALLIAFNKSAFAQENEPVVSAIDTVWVLIAAFLVFFMQAGFGFLEAGFVRSKNVVNIMAENLMDTTMTTMGFIIAGFGIMFGAGNAFFGTEWFFLNGIPDIFPGLTIPTLAFFFFQFAFCAAASTIASGLMAERTNFKADLAYSFLTGLVIYPVFGHWVWGGGWLAEMGFRDFAGGAVVHINAGVAALVAALVIGNRTGFPTTAMPPHNLTATVTGASMLWVGWFGFNAGSAIAANGSAGMAMLVTHTGAAAGAIAWMAMEWLRFGKPSVLGIVTGMVAGLGTITPASGFVGPMGALVIGLIAGVVCFLATQIVKRKLKIDDSLDVFPVHGVGGFTGVLLTAVFSSTALDGLGLAEGVSMGSQLMVQLIGAVVTVVWCGVATYAILKLINLVSPLRASTEQENQGLDLALHEERGYII